MKNDIKFEEAILRLEEIVKRLEGGTLSLDASIDEYEAAIALIKICNDRLSAAEQRVRILTEGADGTVADKDFISNNEA